MSILVLSFFCAILRSPAVRLAGAGLILGSSFTWGSMLSGRVVDRDGEPLAGIEVFVFDAEADSFERGAALFFGVTDRDGGFRIDGERPGSVILKLAGEEGKGRLRLDSAVGQDFLELTYPVRTTLVFLHDNDTHWNFNHLEEFRAAVASYRERVEDVFLLSGGDIFIRHPHRWPEDRLAYYEERSAYMIDAMNALAYDAAVLGNHELHYHGEATRRVLERARFPLLAANVDIETDRLPATIKPHVILETAARYRIGVIGLSSIPEMDGLRELGLFETARVHVDRLRGSTDLLLALTHIGHRRDQELARRISDFDLIVGGHSHTLLMGGHEVNGVLIVQAGGVPAGHPVSDALPKYLGRVKVVLENERVVERVPKVYIFQN